MRPLYPVVRTLAVVAGSALLVFTLSRLALVWLLRERVAAADALPFVLLQGLRFDGVAIGALLLLPCLLLPLLASSRALLPLWKAVLVVYSSTAIAVFLTLELATPPIIGLFDARPNLLFIEYLEYPEEIGLTAWRAYRAILCAGVLTVALGVVGTALALRRLTRAVQPLPFPKALALGLVLSVFCGALMHSAPGARPANPATLAPTGDALVDQLPLSSTYTLARAAYRMRLEESGGARYGDMDPRTASLVVRDTMLVAPEDFLDGSTTWHRFTPSARRRRAPNLLVIVLESVGAEFVGALGGHALTPSLDALARQGIWFEQLYATGTRTVRGIEALISGFPPTLSRSVIKLRKSREGFFTLAAFLRDKGYATSFIYGGEASFDDMRSFFLGNGFERVIERKDFPDPEFVGTWGVSDEEVLERAHRELASAHERDEPYFALVLTSSNHTPFDFPTDRIVLRGAEPNTVENGVSYADFSLGRFFELARAADYWEETIFLVVADHNAVVHGRPLVPIERFRIPGLILGGGIRPRRLPSLASQIDLAPTVLSLMGHAGVHPMPGRDLTSLPDGVRGRAIMQFNEIQAYREGDSVVVLQPGRTPGLFRYTAGELRPAKGERELVEKALAYPTWASHAYTHRAYTFPATSVAPGARSRLPPTLRTVVLGDAAER